LIVAWRNAAFELLIKGVVAMHAERSVGLVGALAVVLLCASATAQCTAPASWFPHDQTPMPSTADPGSDNCRFHQWSWQTFLWLTQKVGGDLRFISQMYSAEEPFSLEKFTQHLPTWSDRIKRRLVLRPRDRKPTDIRGNPAVNQAGDNGILIDQNHHAVYYAIDVNEKYYDFMVNRNYTDPAKLEAASSLDKFPVGTLEIKSSWQIVNDGDDTSGFYTTQAVLQPLQAEHGKVVVKPHDDLSSAPLTTVALVGLHVAGVVTGHPEFIWATFELHNNSPLLKPGTPADAVVSGSSTRFYMANTKAGDCNKPNDGKVTIIDQAKQTLDPVTQVVRANAWGGGTDTTLVQELNKDVTARLAIDGDIATHYRLIGSLWVKDGALQPNQIPGLPDSQAGSIRLANTTMETFRQSVGNCFSCHNTKPFAYNDVSLPALNLNLSHTLIQSYVTNKQLLKRKGQPRVPRAPTK
jgi:hypothetical protein